MNRKKLNFFVKKTTAIALGVLLSGVMVIPAFAGNAPVVNSDTVYSRDGRVILEKGKYDSVSDYQSGRALVENRNNYGSTYAYIDENGKEVITLDSNVNQAHDFHDGIARIESIIDGHLRVYYINTSGKRISRYYSIGNDFSGGMAAVQSGSKWGYINTSGKEIVKPKYYDAYDFSDGLGLVREAKKDHDQFLYINKKGRVALKLPVKYQSAGSFGSGLAWVSTGNKYFKGDEGFINKKGKIVVKPQNKKTFVSLNFLGETTQSEGNKAFNGGVCKFKDNKTEKYGFINNKGKVIIRPEFDKTSIGNCYEGMIPFLDNNYKLGYYNNKGKIAVPAEYVYHSNSGSSYGSLEGDNMNDFSVNYHDGVAVVKGNDSSSGDFYKYIDKNGRDIIGTKFKYALPFNDGIATVSKFGEFNVSYLIDKSGREITKLV